MHVAQTMDPSQTDIDQLHHQYLQAVQELYHRSRAKYGLEHVELDII